MLEKRAIMHQHHKISHIYLCRYYYYFPQENGAYYQSTYHAILWSIKKAMHVCVCVPLLLPPPPLPFSFLPSYPSSLSESQSSLHKNNLGHHSFIQRSMTIRKKIKKKEKERRERLQRFFLLSRF